MSWLLAPLLIAAFPAPAGVVVNELMYHPPDDRDDLQFVELHNPGPQPADLAGWKLARGAVFTFPAGTSIPAGGFLVVAKDPAAFRQYYKVEALGPFAGTLGHGNGRVDLLDARGGVADSVKYKTRTPWPVAPDGAGPSLERVCPSAPGDEPLNWAPSPYPAGVPRAAGTPGTANAAFSPKPLPAVGDIAVTPAHPTQQQELTVTAKVTAAGGVKAVELLYRVAGPGSETAETAVPMAKADGDRYAAKVPGQVSGRLVRVRVKATDAAGTARVFPHEHDLRPAVSVYVHDGQRPTSTVPWGFVVNVGREEFRAARQEPGKNWNQQVPDPPHRGRSAFVYVAAKPNSQPEVFDFITVSPRSAGRKVRFHKDRPLGDMTTINLVFEYMDRMALAEPLAYEAYRKAGNAACRTDFVRTWIDGRPIGYQLLIEQPNKAFVRHAGLNPDGNMYKATWMGDGVAGTHEKKTHAHEDKSDLTDAVKAITRAKGDEQWAAIKKHVDAPQAATYFVVNMVLSHWDGYFNNYYAYHDTRGTGKWTFYPWDQDKTWGFHDGLGAYDVFTDMAITFGMTGDAPPGWPKNQPAPRGFGFNAWWRPPGAFSGPLLANPTFRKLFLWRTKEILETVYTEDVFFPLIKATGERLDPEVAERARLYRQDPQAAAAHHVKNQSVLRNHLTKRREFLLAQDEVKNAVKFDKELLK